MKLSHSTTGVNNCQLDIGIRRYAAFGSSIENECSRCYPEVSVRFYWQGTSPFAATDGPLLTGLNGNNLVQLDHRATHLLSI